MLFSPNRSHFGGSCARAISKSGHRFCVRSRAYFNKSACSFRQTAHTLADHAPARSAKVGTGFASDRALILIEAHALFAKPLTLWRIMRPRDQQKWAPVLRPIARLF